MFGRRRTDVLVAGAGPVGLFVALRLAERGVHVQLIDKHRRTGVHGYALALHSRTLELLEESGVADDVIARGLRVDKLAFMHGDRSRVTVPLARLKQRHPFVLVLPQRELESVLEARLRVAGVRVQWNHRLQSFEQDDDGVAAEIARLDQAPAGYPVARLEWVIEKILRTRSAFLVGADGYHSLVRRQLEIDFKQLAPPETFAVFEFDSPMEHGSEVRVIPEPGRAAILWPMPGGRCRFAFQVAGEDDFEPTLASLNQLIHDRAPWFPSAEGPLHWATLTHFDRRQVSAFGRNRIWLAGDSAHLTCPLGVQSLNAGLEEGAMLAGLLAGCVRDGTPHEILAEYETKRQHAWRRLHGVESIPGTAGHDDEWFRARAGTIRCSLPATGEDLECLLRHIEDDVGIASDSQRT